MSSTRGKTWDADPHTLAKIEILQGYLDAYFPILGRGKPGRDILYIDGFAGPGEYANSPTSSPLAALGAARSALSKTGEAWRHRTHFQGKGRCKSRRATNVYLRRCHVLACLAAPRRGFRRPVPLRRRADDTPSIRHPGKPMGDGEAFELLLKDEMQTICGVVNYNVLYRGQARRMERVLYKWFRCELLHAGRLPLDLKFEPDPQPKLTRVKVDGTTILRHGWLDGLTDAIVQAPENADQFGLPPKPPFPTHLARIN